MRADVSCATAENALTKRRRMASALEGGQQYAVRELMKPRMEGSFERLNIMRASESSLEAMMAVPSVPQQCRHSC
jgi:hypothetical protein